MVAVTICGMYDPWRQLRALTDWVLEWAPLPAGRAGETWFHHQVIRLDPRLGQAERRCTLAHELQHVQRGYTPVERVLVARDEEAVERAAARLLIDVRDLGEALAWSQHLDVVAEELWVDRATLEARLRGLHPSERAYLQRRLGQVRG